MTTTLRLDSTIYCLEAIEKAAYRFIDRLTIVLSQQHGYVVCDIDPVKNYETAFEEVLADFKRELLDQQLRVQIKKETEPTRNLILAYAFSRTGLQQ